MEVDTPLPAAGEDFNKDTGDADGEDAAATAARNEVKVGVEGRMQAAEQRAGCSGAVQPQGGRFPLCV